MITFDDYGNENKTQHNLDWPYIPDWPYRILIIGGSGSGKRNALWYLINNQPDIDKIYLYEYIKHNLYQFSVNERGSPGLKHFNDPKAFMSIQMICKMFTKILIKTMWVKTQNINSFWWYDCWYD